MQRRAFPLLALALAGVLSVAPAAAQVRWDLAAAYPATNFHTENLMQFAKDVEAGTGGKLRITVHANASLFKANEIKRAVQGGQAPAGEILLPNFENENAVFGADGIRSSPPRTPNPGACTKPRSPCWSACSVRRGCACSTRSHGRRRASTARRRSPPWRTCAASSGVPTALPQPRSRNSSARSR